MPAPPADQRPLDAQKNALRTELKTRRLATENRAALDAQLACQVLGLAEVQAAPLVAAYVSRDDEAGTGPLLERLWAAGRQVGVPLCLPGHQLAVLAVAGWAELTPGKYGIWEPLPEIARDPARRCPPAALTVVITPGLGFDRRGGRLGYGRGHFDRLFAQCSPDVVRIGLCYDSQVVDAVPTGPQDAAMHYVVTPTQVLRTAGSAGSRSGE